MSLVNGPSRRLAHLARHEAITMAFFRRLLWAMALLFFAALLLVPLMRRAVKPAQKAIEAH